jgi:diguanylate cyclase (GGDEF)-like protein/PAS domain S-box-containing protein
MGVAAAGAVVAVVGASVLVGWAIGSARTVSLAPGEAIAAVTAAAIGTGVLWRSAVLVARFERARAAASDELERVNADLQDQIAARTATIQTVETVQRESLDALEEGVAVISADLELLLINRSGRRLLGYEPDEITALWQSGRWETYREDGTPLPRRERPVARSLATGEPTSGVVVRWRAKDGSMIPLRLSTRPLFDGDAVSGLVIAFADVTADRAGSGSETGEPAAEPGGLPAIGPRQRILVAAPRSATTEELRRQLAFAGHDVLVVNSADEAQVGARKRRPALVIADVGGDGLDGDAVLALIKGDPLTAHVPVLLLTEPVSGAEAARALVAGAFDVVRKPIEAVELVARVDAALRASTRTSDLVHLSRSLDRVSRTDALTGLLNRRGIDDQVDRLEGLAQRRGDTSCAMAIDLDRFKSINDRFGHLAGDRALRAVADVVNEELRTDDVAGRWGGEEFVVLLPDADLDGAAAAAERMRAAVEALEIEADDGMPFGLTISVGVAEVVGGDLRAAIAVADRRLLAAKQAGRNRVHIDDDAVA